ncbi:MAG: beta-N-acetylhexosaminidase [Candidatus Firestonebacteria bacterium]
MKIKLHKNEIFNELINEYPEYFSFSSGRFLRFNKWDELGFALYSRGKDIAVNYNTTSDMFRALGILMLNLSKKGEMKIKQIPPFKFRGLMIDSSRNAVIKEEYLKKIIIKLSLLGINYLTLYTEDTYEVEGHPFIGYQRGKYTKDELRRLSQFAKKFGIEMFPCIQTLGHVEQILKFPYYADVKDDDRIFSVKSKKTYQLIETLLENASEPYTSKLVHIGMDETWGLGRGKCFEINKKIDPRMMYIKHLNKVNDICKKLKLQPIMWGDIVVGISETEAMTREQTCLLPRNVIMNYWNYNIEDRKTYERAIRSYREIGYEPFISSGAWNWNRSWGLYGKVERTMVLLMEVAKKLKVNQAMFTMWGDDGQEAPFDSNWPGLVLYAEHGYSRNVDMALVKKMIKVVTRDDWDSFVLPAKMDSLNDKSISSVSNMSKCFLYDDPLLGIYTSHTLGNKINPYGFNSSTLCVVI